MLQGRIVSALKLLKYGLHLLVEWEKCTASARASADTKLAIHAIRSFFIRYSQQALWVSSHTAHNFYMIKLVLILSSSSLVVFRNETLAC